MAAPELQPLALEAKSAAAVLKYLPVRTEQIPEVLAALEETSRHEQWPVRAAALVYAQVLQLPQIGIISTLSISR